MMFRPTLLSKGVLVVTWLTLSMPAVAQPTPLHEMEALTVTAQKREENVQDVPLSMDVFSGDRIAEFGARDVQDLVDLSPNLFIKSNTAENLIVIRGVSTFMSALFSPAGFYIDDVPATLSYMQNPALFDIERVEVLKGPQGTLYGRNTESGLISVITRQPDNNARGKLFGEWGTFDSAPNDGMFHRAGGAVSGPVVKDRLFAGLSFEGLDSDGFMTDHASGDEKSGRQEHLSGRGVFKWTPTDATSFSFMAGGSHEDDGFGVFRLVDGEHATSQHIANSGDPGLGKESDSTNQSLRIEHRAPGWTLVSISAHQDHETGFTSDMDFNGGPKFADFAYDDTQYSQEIRLSSATDGPLDWLVGLYGHQNEIGTRLTVKAEMNGNIMEFWDPAGEIDMEGQALFSQITWHATPRLHLTGGLRVDHQELDGVVTNANTTMISGAGTRFEEELTYDELLPKAAIAYDLTEDFTTYASVAKGFQSGGYNYSMVVSPDAFTYDPEYTWNYELGFKSRWQNRKLTVNGSIYYIDIQDKQIDVDNPDVEGVPMAPDITNAGEAHTYGMELDVNAFPYRGLELFASVGLTESEIDRWQYENMQGQIVDYKGKSLVYAPDYNFNLGAQYRFDSGLFVRGDLVGRGEFYGDAANTVSQDAYELVHARIGYEAEHFDVAFWCRNLFDREYATLVAAIMPTGDSKIVEGDPRTIGVTCTCRF